MSRNITKELFAEQIRAARVNTTNQIEMTKVAKAFLENYMKELELFNEYHGSLPIRNKLRAYKAIDNQYERDLMRLNLVLENIGRIEAELSRSHVTEARAQAMERALNQYSDTSNNVIVRRIEIIREDYLSFKNDSRNYGGVVETIKNDLNEFIEYLDDSIEKFDDLPDISDELKELYKKVDIYAYELQGELSEKNPFDDIKLYEKITDLLIKGRDLMDEGEELSHEMEEDFKIITDDNTLDPNGTYGAPEIIARNKMANFYTQNGVRRRISEYKALQLRELLNHKIKLDR